MTPARRAIAWDGQRRVDMRLHQPDRLGEPRIVAVEPAERDQRLRVGGGAGLVVDEDARDIERHGHAEPRADQMEHQVEGRRGAAGGEDRSVDDVAVGPHIVAGKGGGEILQVFPMGGGGAPFEQAGAAEQPGAGLDAADRAGALSPLAVSPDSKRRAAWSRVPKPPTTTSTIGRLRRIERVRRQRPAARRW